MFDRVATDAAGDEGDDAEATDLEVWIDCEQITATGTLFDASGRGSTITCETGMCPALVPGPRGMACELDGNDDVVVVAPSPRFQRPSFTIAVWLRLDVDVLGYVGAWVKHTQTDSFEVWAVYAHGDPVADRLIAGGDSTGVYQFGETGPYALAQWTHVAVTHDATTREFGVYRDGMLVQTVTDVSIVDHASELVLGAERTAASRIGHWPGALDDAKLYGRVLTAAEIADIATP